MYTICHPGILLLHRFLLRHYLDRRRRSSSKPLHNFRVPSFVRPAGIVESAKRGQRILLGYMHNTKRFCSSQMFDSPGLRVQVTRSLAIDAANFMLKEIPLQHHSAPSL